MQIVAFHLRCYLSELTCLIHCPHISKSYPGLGFGAQDFHLRVSGYLPAFTTVSSDNSGSQLYPVVLVSSVAVPVTKDFFSPAPNPQPGEPVDHFSSDLYPLTCPAWVTLPEPKPHWHNSPGHWGTQGPLMILQGVHLFIYLCKM